MSHPAVAVLYVDAKLAAVDDLMNPSRTQPGGFRDGPDAHSVDSVGFPYEVIATLRRRNRLVGGSADLAIPGLSRNGRQAAYRLTVSRPVGLVSVASSRCHFTPIPSVVKYSGQVLHSCFEVGGDPE